MKYTIYDICAHLTARRTPVATHMRQAFALTLLTALAICAAPAGTIHVWEKQELTFTSTQSFHNPYTEVIVWVDLTGPNLKKRFMASGMEATRFAFACLQQRRVSGSGRAVRNLLILVYRDRRDHSRQFPGARKRRNRIRFVEASFAQHRIIMPWSRLMGRRL